MLLSFLPSLTFKYLQIIFDVFSFSSWYCFHFCLLSTSIFSYLLSSRFPISLLLSTFSDFIQSFFSFFFFHTIFTFFHFLFFFFILAPFFSPASFQMLPVFKFSLYIQNNSHLMNNFKPYLVKDAKKTLQNSKRCTMSICMSI